MISAFSALNGWTLLTARVSLAASGEGLFPSGRCTASVAPRLRASRGSGAGDRARVHELHELPGRPVHLHAAAGYAHDRGAVLRGGRRSRCS